MAEEAILRLLRERGAKGVLQSELAEHIGFSKSTISYFLSKLESKGAIVRRRVPGSGFRVWLKGVESPSKLVRIGIVRAAEYPFIFDFKSRLEEEGFGVYVKVYNDGVAVMSDLVKGKIDACFSPLITQLVFYAVSRGKFRIVASGVSGGGSIVLMRGVKLNEVKRAGSTFASTMDACLATYLRERGLSDVEVVYFESPQRMVEALERKEVQMLSIWEPYVSILESKGHERMVRFSDYIGPYPCCVLAVNPVEEELANLMIEKLIDSLSKRDYVDQATKLSNLIDVEPSIVRKSILEYTFQPTFEVKDINRYLRAVRLEIAIPWISRGLRGYGRVA
ncbi:MAG: MarR family transcriptional regulator [Candidatus Nezhaarchaeales archaeon]